MSKSDASPSHARGRVDAKLVIVKGDLRVDGTHVAELPPGVDTHDEAELRMLEHWRKASPTQKAQRMFGMARMVNELARAELRLRYPSATPREIDLRLRSRSLDRETMIRVFGWDPDLHGR